MYPVVHTPAAGGLTGLDRSITVLADSPRCMAEMICTGVVAAIGEICALDTGSRSRCGVWLQWVRHRFPHSHELCRASSMTPSPPRAQLKRSFHPGDQPTVFLVRAGLIIVWLQLDASGFRLVLARGWHAPGCLGSSRVKMVTASITAGTRARYPAR